MQYSVLFSGKTSFNRLFFPNFADMKDHQPCIERHPWPPYVPHGAKYLFLGTFPPKVERWSMPFFYPNKINDFWRIMGLIFHQDKDYFWIKDERCFDLAAIKAFLEREGIALWDTAMAVRRLKDNASDKFLEIVEEIKLEALLDQHPTITTIVTTGEKATSVIAAQADIEIPSISIPVNCQVGTHGFTLLRMPSTSRAYPLPLLKKAEAYRQVFGR